MVRKINRNQMFLAQKCELATKADAQIAQDLLDTLRDNIDHCVGMCANMIGEKKTIIAIAAGPFQFVMINPVITKKTSPTPDSAKKIDFQLKLDPTPDAYKKTDSWYRRNCYCRLNITLTHL